MCHHTSHLLIHECDGFAKLLQSEAKVIPVPQSSGYGQKPLMYEDVNELLDATPRPYCFVLEVSCYNS